jgi:hypothetical protein
MISRGRVWVCGTDAVRLITYFEGADGASSFQVSRTASHFPSVLRQVARNFPTHTVVPAAVTSLDVPADQPMSPDTTEL